MKDKDDASGEGKLPSLKKLDAQLRDELRGKRLVGEIDLDRWGELSFDVLSEKAKTREPAVLARDAPAVLTTYLCWCARHNRSEGKTFWPTVHVPELRNGTEAGQAFLAALRTLGLPTFDDLERLEAIAGGGKYIRRIHLHSGLPVQSVRRVLDLLAATLRSTAGGAQEVIDAWTTSNIASYGLDKPSERLVLYTGDFGAAIIDGFIELMRAFGRRQVDLSSLGLAPYLVTAFDEWVPTHDPSRFEWVFIQGPRVEVDRFGSRGAFVRVPRGDVDWMMNEQFLGSSSDRSESEFDLEPATEWRIAQRGGKAIFLPSLHGTGVWLFNERGRLHRGGTLLGSTAYLIARPGVEITGTVERRPLASLWTGWDLVTVDLRALSELVVTLFSGATIEPIPVDSSWSADLTGDLVGGVTGPHGQPVVGTQVRLRPAPGYFPDADDLTVSVRWDAATVDQRRLSSCREENERDFDLTGLFPDVAVFDGVVEVGVPGSDPIRLPVLRIPGFSADVPLLAAPDTTVEIPIEHPSHLTAPDSVTVAPDADRARFLIGTSPDDDVELAVHVDRCRWEVQNPKAIVPDFDGEEFVVRPQEMRGGTLEILTDDAANLRLWLQDRDGRQLQRLKLQRRHPDAATATASLNAALDTANAHDNTLFDLVLRAFDGRAVRLGQVQTGPSTVGGLEVKAEDSKKRTRLKVRWDEPRPWPDRVIRVWRRDGDVPVAEEPVEDDVCTARIKLDRTVGAHLVELGEKSGGWTKLRRPDPGPTCATVFLGEGAYDVIDAVKNANHRAEVDDDTVADMPQLLADLWLHGVSGRPLNSSQRNVLTTLTFDNPTRMVTTLVELAALENEDAQLDADAWGDIVVQAFDCAISVPDIDQGRMLEQLWELRPTAAAAADGELDGPRWKTGASWTWDESTGVKDGLDALCRAVRRGTQVRPQELHVLGETYVPPPLSAHDWYLLGETKGLSFEEPAGAWIDSWTNEPPTRGRVFAGLFLGTRLGSISFKSGNEEAIRALVGAQCMALDPTSTPDERQRASAALVRAEAAAPEFVSTCSVFAVAAMQALKHAPGWNTRNG